MRNPFKRYFVIVEPHETDPTRDVIRWGRVQNDRDAEGILYYTARSAQWHYLLIQLGALQARVADLERDFVTLDAARSPRAVTPAKQMET